MIVVCSNRRPRLLHCTATPSTQFKSKLLIIFSASSDMWQKRLTFASIVQDRLIAVKPQWQHTLTGCREDILHGKGRYKD